MKKNLITAAGLLSLLVLSYVGIAQFRPKNAHPQKEQAQTDKETAQATNKNGEAMPLMTLDSGLQYRILNHGNGETTPKPGQTVTVHYDGWLDNGGQPDKSKKFDSSVDRGKPFSFVVGVGQVIKGWDEGVLSMRAGEKRHLIIPADLGYGAGGYPPIIPRNATLHFEVTLLDIK